MRRVFIGVMAGLGLVMSVGGVLGWRHADRTALAEQSSANWVAYVDTPRRQIELVDLASLNRHPLNYGSLIEGVDADPTTLQVLGENVYFYEQNQHRVYRMSLSGDEAPKLISTPLPEGMFSPDAHWIYYFAPANIPGSDHFEVHRMTLDAQTHQQLTDTYVSHHYEPLDITRPLSLSPDGNWIAYSFGNDFEHPLVGELWLMQADGTQHQRVLERYPDSVTWSPDSQWLAASYQVGNGPHDAVLYNVTTQATRELPLEMWAFQGALAVAPGGETVVFAGDCGDTSNIATCLFKVQPDGSVREEFFRIEDSMTDLGFSPDGQWLTFSSTPEPLTNAFGKKFYRLRVDGTGLQPIFTTSEESLPLHWVSSPLTLTVAVAAKPSVLLRIILIIGLVLLAGLALNGLLAKVQARRSAPKIKTKRRYVGIS